MQQVHLYIHGEHRKTTSGIEFQTINPATGEVLALIDQASEQDVNDAIASAKAGFAVWSRMSALERSRILLKAVALLRQYNDELATLEVQDTGKPIQEASVVDIVTGADVIEYFANLAPSQHGIQQPISESAFFYTREEPLGVCAGIGAWNYPIQIAMWKAAPALAAGNAMVFKPSEETPLTAMRLAEIFTEAGLPAGVFNVVQGDYRVGQYLSRHPEIEKISFTGESNTGRKVMADSAASLKHVTMELGGKSPLIIFDDCDIDRAVTGAMLANFYTQGEVCTNGTRVFVHEKIYDSFLTELKRRTELLVIGDPLSPETQIGALISEKHLKKVLSFIEQAQSAGARLITGGKRVTEQNLKTGFFVEPTVFADCSDDMPNVQHEIFGPVMSVLKFTDEKEVIERANLTEFGLAAGVFTKDLSRAHRVIHQINAGICWINTWGNSPAEMPVGGYKQSGIGRENGVATYKQFTQTKSIYIETGDLASPYL